MLLDDLAKELYDYPEMRVKIKIVDFEEPGGKINPGEVCTFRVRVVNNGQLDMHGLKLHVHAKKKRTEVSQTDVWGAPVNFASTITTAPMNIPPGGGFGGDTNVVYAGPQEDIEDGTVQGPHQCVERRHHVSDEEPHEP